MPLCFFTESSHSNHDACRNTQHVFYNYRMSRIIQSFKITVHNVMFVSSCHISKEARRGQGIEKYNFLKRMRITKIGISYADSCGSWTLIELIKRKIR